MSIVTDYYNNEAVFSFTSETAFTLPSYNSRPVITIKNLSAPDLTLTAFGTETIDGNPTYVVGGNSTAKIVKGDSGWVVVEGSDSSITGVFTVSNTTEATTGGAGAIVTSGGIYATKAIVSGSATDSTSITTGGIIGAGGLGITKALWVGGLANVAGVTTLSNTTDSSSSTTGGTIISGGVGIAKKLYVGTTANVAGVTSVTDTTEATIAGVGAAVVSGGIYAAKKIISATGTVALGGNSLVQSIAGNATVTNATAVGSAFANQPANDGVEIGSDNAADTTQTATVIGTTTGTDTVVAESILLTGTTFVSTVKTDWGVILAVKLDASCAGTVTFREASGNATIVTLATTVLQAGVNTATNTTAFNKVLSVVADGATTKQIGWKGTNAAGTTIYDSQALNGTTAVLSNSAFQTVTEIYSGDIENTVTTTTTQGLSGPDYAGTATNDDAQAGKIGELLSAQLAAASTTSLTTATGKTIISKALTAGDWEVSGAVHFVPANTTTVTNLVAGISATDNTQPSSDSIGGYAENSNGYTAAGTVWNTVVVPPVRVSLAATTTYYLVATATFGASTCTGHGFIRARRCR